MTKKLFSAPFIIFMICGTLIPACVIAYYGFTDRSGVFMCTRGVGRAPGQHAKALGLSLLLAFISTAICLLLAFPLGLILKGTKLGRKGFMIFVFILPMWMNFLLRTMAWQVLLEKNGIINSFLAAIGLPQLTITRSSAGVPTVASDEDGALSLQEIYRRCIGSVVSIVTVTPSGKASGTGIIMSEDGYVITNHHVIESAQAVSVLTADSQEYTASVVGSDETSDLAVLKIEAEGLQAAEFGDSSVLQVGDSVAAIGDPLGTALRGTMTDGIVSAINRDLTVNDRTMSLIQTNAALNNGNSGGPLINCYGQVIGINTMKMSNFYSSSMTVEGIGFAIPIDTAKPIIDELIEKGYVSGRPAIGIDGETLPATYRIYYRLPQGIYVTRVYRNSDAAAKGISEGDIITAINGVSVTTMEQLNRVKNQFTAGQTITLTIYHGGVSSDVEIILMDRANA